MIRKLFIRLFGQNYEKSAELPSRGAVERGGFWAGAAHPRRQKHREMPPPGASAPAFAATVEPAFTQITSDLPPAYLQSGSSNERVLGMTCAVFPVYTLMRASILDFKPKLANRCKLFPVYTLFRASILDFKPKLANQCRGEWFRLLIS